MIVLIGCESDSVPINNTTSETKPFIPTASFAVNGVNVTDQSNYFFVTRCENTFLLCNGTHTVNFFFNKDGKFGSFEMDLGATTQPNIFYNYKNFSSHYINFQLISLDEVNKRVKGKLFGNVWRNPFDINSEGKYIELNFEYTYYDVAPLIKDIGNRALINGKEWIMTDRHLSRGVGNSYYNITQHDLSNDEYKIMVNYNTQTIALGTYDFVETDITNNIKLVKYDLSTGTNIIYNCTGILNIIQKENLGDYSNPAFILSGNYNFTAVNPNDSNDVIHVTDGLFKLFFQNF